MLYTVRYGIIFLVHRNNWKNASNYWMTTNTVRFLLVSPVIRSVRMLISQSMTWHAPVGYSWDYLYIFDFWCPPVQLWEAQKIKQVSGRSLRSAAPPHTEASGLRNAWGRCHALCTQAIIHPDTGEKIFMPFRMSGTTSDEDLREKNPVIC